ncbi:MAG: DUF924 family protein [Alphaproteobacteria bacterium]|jgi:uncharacterized protein (DUF924 family)
MNSITPEKVYDFWFAESGPERWFAKDPSFDAAIRFRFASAIAAARESRLDHWAAAAKSCLSLILVIDQFSRNVFRLSPLAWSADHRARALTVDALERGYDGGMTTSERKFLYMPLMHSEDLADQERCVELFAALLAEDPEGEARSHESAIRHRDIVTRFGRFPHRNAVLGRPSSAEEIAFLQEPNSSF